MDRKDIFSQNEKELMDFYDLKGSLGKLRIRAKILKTWILHKSAYSSINSSPEISKGSFSRSNPSFL